jgi:hypothetical protein
MTFVDRRQITPFDAAGPLRCRSVTLDLVVSVLDFNAGGLLIETSMPFMPSVEHIFEVATRDGACIALVRARAVYSHRRTASEREATYASGFAFVDLQEPATRQQIRALLDAAAPNRASPPPPAVLSYDTVRSERALFARRWHMSPSDTGTDRPVRA